MNTMIASLLKFLIGMCWFPVASVAYIISFGARMILIAAQDGWRAFK